MKRRFGTVRQLPSGRFQARYTGPDGRIYRAPNTFAARSHADRWLSGQDAEISRGTWQEPEARPAPPQVQTLAVYAAEALGRRRLRPTSLQAYRQVLRASILPVLGDKEVAAITPADVNRWYSSLKGTPTQAANAYALLRSIFRQALEDELIERNPCRIRGGASKERASEAAALTASELGEFLQLVDNPDHRAALTLAGWCGLRSGEVRGLRRRDLDLSAGVVRIVQQVVRVGGRQTVSPPKTRAAVRSVAIPPSVIPALRAWLADQPMRGADALVFHALGSDEPLSQQTLQASTAKASKRFGRTVRIHDLRHTSMTLAALAGATVGELQARAGHTTAAMALRYQHATSLRDAAIAERMAAL